MYETHFGLRVRPFRPTPDSDSYYPATTHEYTLARLLQAIADDEGLILLTGEPGTGKTLALHRLLERVGTDTLTAFLTNSHAEDAIGLLQTILYDLSLSYEHKVRQELRLALTEFFLQNHAEGKKALILVDEAQHLTPEMLEELRLLGNLEAGRSKAVQVVLAAQVGIDLRLRRAELAAFRQRLVVRAHLEPLDVHESADYLCHHLRLAGGRPEAILNDEALQILARHTGGVPRLLNQACHQTLAVACMAETAPADAEAALEACSILGLAEVPEEEEPPHRRSAG
jgi:type II secretory pathway predicted ATPase ExeA